MSETRKANIRFDMDNEMHRKAWQLLQERDKTDSHHTARQLYRP